MLLGGGLVLLLAGLFWIVHPGRRAGRPPDQRLWDFVTGAPLDSVLAVGAVLFGLLLITASLLR